MHILDLLFPPRCVGCRKVGSYICKKCYASIRFIEYQICPVCMRPAMGGVTHLRCRTPLALDGMFAAAHYQGVMRDAVRELKYRYVRDLVSELGVIFMSHYPNALPEFDFLIPVPLHTKREKERGFNQSEVLAKQLGRQLRIPVTDGILKRVKDTIPQFGLDKKKRKENVSGAFSLSERKNMHSKTIALVDDVATTMATLSECAKILKRNGAKSIWALVLAHG